MADGERKLSAAEVVGNFGPLPVFKWRGKEWKVSHCCPRVMQRMESSIAADAYDNLEM